MIENEQRVRLPRLLQNTLDGSVLKEQARLHPSKLSPTLRMQPLSTATMIIPEDDPEIMMHDWMELYNQHGSCGIFRVVDIQPAYGKNRSVTLNHALDILNDAVYPSNTEEFDGTVTAYLTKLLGAQKQKIGNSPYWQLGTVEDTGNWHQEFNYDNILDLIKEVPSEHEDYYYTFDFSVFPWRLNLVARNDDVLTEFRASRNIESCKVTQSDKDQCTRLYLSVTTKSTVTEQGRTAGKKSTTTFEIHDDPTGQAVWGIIEKTAGIENDKVPAAQKAAWVQGYFERHRDPAVQITIDGYDLKEQTGESIDEMHLARVCRAVLPKYNTILLERIVEVTYPDALRQPDRVSVSMANKRQTTEDNIASAQKEAKKAGASAGAASRAVEEQAEQQAQQYQHWTEENDVYRESVYKIMGVELNADGTVKYVQATDEQGNPIYDEQGNPVWKTDAAGNPVPVYNEQSDGSIASKVLESAQRLEQTVTYTSLNTTIGSYLTQTAWETRMGNYLEVNKDGVKVMKGIAQVVTMINEQNGTGTVLIEGDKVQINGGSGSSVKLSDKIIIQSDGYTKLVGQVLVGNETYKPGYNVEFTNGKVTAHDVQVRSGGSLTFSGSSDGEYYSLSTSGSTNQRIQNVVTGFDEAVTDENGDVKIPYHTVYRLGTAKNGQSINFNIADMAYHINALSAARNSIDLRYQWGSPVSETDQSQDHGKKYTLTMASASLGYTTQEEQETGEGSSETVEVWHQTRGPLSITSANITGVYNDGYEDGWGAAFGKVTWPSAQIANAYMDVSAPPQTVDGNATAKRYHVRSTANDAYISILNPDGESWTNYAKVTHNQCNIGKSQVGLKTPEWLDSTDDDHPNTYLISTNGRVNSTTGDANEEQTYLTPTDAITLGQNSVSAALVAVSAVPEDATSSPLVSGVYDLQRVVSGTPASHTYYTVSSGGGAYTGRFIVSSSGDTIPIYNSSGMSVVGRLYPNTPITSVTPTTIMLRTYYQFTYDGVTGYSPTSNFSSIPGATNYPTRIGWVGGDDSSYSAAIAAKPTEVTENGTYYAVTDNLDGYSSFVVNVSGDSGNSANIQTNKTVTYTANGSYTLLPSSGYDAMSRVAVTVDVPSGVSSQRTASGLDGTIVLPASHTGTGTISGNIVVYDDDSESIDFPVIIDASAVYQQGRTDGASASPRTISSLSKITLSASDVNNATKTTTATFSDSTTQSSVNIVINAKNVYDAGVAQGQKEHDINASSPTVQTGSVSGRKSAGSISGASVYSARNGGYIFFTATCGSKTQNFYITINA